MASMPDMKCELSVRDGVIMRITELNKTLEILRKHAHEQVSAEWHKRTTEAHAEMLRISETIRKMATMIDVPKSVE